MSVVRKRNPLGEVGRAWHDASRGNALGLSKLFAVPDDVEDVTAFAVPVDDLPARAKATPPPLPREDYAADYLAVEAVIEAGFVGRNRGLIVEGLLWLSYERSVAERLTDMLVATGLLYRDNGRGAWKLRKLGAVVRHGASAAWFERLRKGTR